jgi:hypothetical protein
MNMQKLRDELADMADTIMVCHADCTPDADATNNARARLGYLASLDDATLRLTLDVRSAPRAQAPAA